MDRIGYHMASIILIFRCAVLGNTIHTDVSPFGDSPYINVTYIVHNQPQVKQHDDYNNNNMTIPDEQRLMTYILNGYEKSVRPVRNASTAVKIKMGMTLGQIFDMDEKNQVLVTNVWLDQEWSDEFLQWTSTDFNNITNLRIPCDKIWLPDIVLYNNAAEYTDGLMSANAMVKPNGDVFWPVPAKLQSSCKVDVTYFPFDEQRCKLKFGSWTYDGFQVDILNRTSAVDLDNYVVNGEWELLSITIERNVVYYQCCTEPFPDVTFYIHIRRRTLYYMYNVVFPCIMMSALTLLVFCLPPDSGEKIALGITVLLAFSVFMLAVAENLPETSEFVPLISVYLTIVMSLTSISVIMTVLVLNLHHRGPDRHEIPHWMRHVILGKLRPFFCINDSSSPLMASKETKMLRSMSLKMTLDNIAHELQNDIQMENGMADTVVTDNQGTSLHSPRDIRFNSLQGENLRRGRTKTSRGHAYSRINDEILQSLHKVIDKHEREDYDYEIIQDWRRVAQVVDRVLFWIFFLGTLISTIIVLVICPTFR